MTAPWPDFRLAQPGTIKEAIAALLSHPGSRFVAGGTDLIVNMRRGISLPDLLVDLSGIDELNEIKTTGHEVTIGTGGPVTATWGRLAAICASIPAAFTTIKANGGGTPMHIVSRIVGTFVMLLHRDSTVTRPTVAILRPLCSFLAPKLTSPAPKAIAELP